MLEAFFGTWEALWEEFRSPMNRPPESEWKTGKRRVGRSDQAISAEALHG